jgi:hypothetical protein
MNNAQTLMPNNPQSTTDGRVIWKPNEWRSVALRYSVVLASNAFEGSKSRRKVELEAAMLVLNADRRRRVNNPCSIHHMHHSLIELIKTIPSSEVMNAIAETTAEVEALAAAQAASTTTTSKAAPSGTVKAAIKLPSAVRAAGGMFGTKSESEPAPVAVVPPTPKVPAKVDYSFPTQRAVHNLPPAIKVPAPKPVEIEDPLAAFKVEGAKTTIDLVVKHIVQHELSTAHVTLLERIGSMLEASEKRVAAMLDHHRKELFEFWTGPSATPEDKAQMLEHQQSQHPQSHNKARPRILIYGALDSHLVEYQRRCPNAEIVVSKQTHGLDHLGKFDLVLVLTRWAQNGVKLLKPYYPEVIPVDGSQSAVLREIAQRTHNVVV